MPAGPHPRRAGRAISDGARENAWHPPWIVSLRQRLSICDATVRAHLDPGEDVLAVGRCEDITERGSIEAGGAAWTYAMVTDRRLRWVPRGDLRFEASLDLDDVTSASERSLAHRYSIAMEHAPLARAHARPAHRFLVFGWGNAVGPATFVHTALAFSRRDTEAAEALRAQLRHRNRI